MKNKKKIIQLIESYTICWNTDLNAVTKLYFFGQFQVHAKWPLPLCIVIVIPNSILVSAIYIEIYKLLFYLQEPTPFGSIPFGAHMLFRPRARRTD